jgi:hypothetical protein
MWSGGNASRQDVYGESLPETPWAASDALRQKAPSMIPAEQNLLEEIRVWVFQS